MKSFCKARIIGAIFILLSASSGYAQWSDGPFLSISGQVGMPLNKEIKAYGWAAGGVGKFALPLGTNDYCTLSMNAISINGNYKGKGLKERDILSGMIGYRYDFRKEDNYSYFSWSLRSAGHLLVQTITLLLYACRRVFAEWKSGLLCFLLYYYG
ncbi:hypothetical protein [Paraflavitalea speifideaquila]|uniref:hypothetical protein n=1 Tax=Paraflavitalea speifideaquila TaxID=3076558 RepID=UPI0028EE6CB0|nr:hypothetical protein [Paraflavitalea speifideiaquila]